MRTVIALLSACVLIAGCAAGPDYERPPIAAPDKIRGEREGAVAGEVSFADQAWWEIFEDETLASLIEEALIANYDVRIAAWRVEESRANAGIAKSEFYPQIQAGGRASRIETSEFVTPLSEPTELYDVNVGLTWEIDLWGRIRRLKEAALARYLATEEARRGVMLSLVSDVATAYFRLRALDLQLEIARRTAEAFRATHSLFDGRLASGLGSSLETTSAAASLASTTANIPDLEREIAAQENLISFLLGRNPGDVLRGRVLNEQFLPPEIPPVIPSELLERRPDLRLAEQELVAANAEVGVAVANYFPRISLTGAFGGVAPEVEDLFVAGKAWSVGAEILTPIVQGGRLWQEHRAAVARWEQVKVRYEQTVTNAFSEVATALVAYQRLAEVEHERAQAVAAYSEAVGLANTRYLSGLSDYFEVLQAQRQLFPAENSLAETRFLRLATLVELYRALGGGWQLSTAEWSRSDPNTDER